MESAAAAVRVAWGIAKVKEGVDVSDKGQSGDRTEVSALMSLQHSYNLWYYIEASQYLYCCRQRKRELAQAEGDKPVGRITVVGKRSKWKPGGKCSRTLRGTFGVVAGRGMGHCRSF